MRDLTVIIEQMLSVIPEDEDDFRGSLEAVKTSALYTAPEAVTFRWVEAADIVNEYLPYPPDKEWERACVQIFTGNPAW